MAERRSLYVAMQSLVTTFDGHPGPGPSRCRACETRVTRELPPAGKDLSFVPYDRSGWSMCATTTWRRPVLAHRQVRPLASERHAWPPTWR